MLRMAEGYLASSAGSVGSGAVTVVAETERARDARVLVRSPLDERIPESTVAVTM